jgi:type I restriction enzyme R subunit
LTPRAFNPSEITDSQLPAAMLLWKLGYEILTADDVRRLRGGREANVLLEPIIRERIVAINSFQWKGGRHTFTEGDAEEAIRKLKPSTAELRGLERTNQDIYDTLMLGASVQKAMDGDRKSFTVKFVDWENPAANVYHAALEMPVQRTASLETRRPDIVLFVNGIPFAVIENKAVHAGVDQAISQTIRNQNADEIPGLFHYAQLLVAAHRSAAQYASVGAPKKYWMVWKEPDPPALADLVNAPLTPESRAAIFNRGFAEHAEHFEHQAAAGPRVVTEQDRALNSLCRPERLLEFTRTFTVFDGGVRKIARHQQYFAVKETLARVREDDGEGRRRGGVIWHTQGSGKSLTMVMLGKALAFAKDIVRDPRIVIVTDRVDLDTQISDTFKACELEPAPAKSGKHLLELLRGGAGLITTVIDKFEGAADAADGSMNGRDIFVMIDESHRSNYGRTAARMRRLLPKACYLGFTGTPLLKSEKSTLRKFGGLIHKYAIDEATADKAVVPLLYEGRLVDQRVSGPEVDNWFERLTEGLNDSQKADLRRKVARAQMLAKTDQSLYAKALDISEHYRRFWQGTGFKAQLVAPSRAAAIRMKEVLDEIGHVSSEIIMSAPDTRDGNDEVDAESKDRVRRFWDAMMKRYGGPEAYERSILDRFVKTDGDPEILIVVSKLLTGFDAPRNTVLYLCKSLKEHNLLQAIARVNRLFEQDGKTKEFGHIIDYQGLLGELDHALTEYSSLKGYDDDDLIDVVLDVAEEIRKLRSLHGEVWDVFRSVRNKLDMEAMELFLGDDPVRHEFYARQRAFGRCLHIALGSEKAADVYSDEEMEGFRGDWKAFDKLRRDVRIRYQEATDFREYEGKIRALLDRHMIASPAQIIVEEVDITKPGEIERVLKEAKVSDASKADRIASATKRTITERMPEDPALYRSLFDMLNEAILAYRERRLSEKAYLDRIRTISRDTANARTDRVFPSSIAEDADAQAVFGVLSPQLERKGSADVTADLAAGIVSIVKRRLIVDFWRNDVAQKELLNELDDYLFDESRAHGLALSTTDIDAILTDAVRVLRARLEK